MMFDNPAFYLETVCAHTGLPRSVLEKWHSNHAPARVANKKDSYPVMQEREGGGTDVFVEGPIVSPGMQSILEMFGEVSISGASFRKTMASVDGDVRFIVNSPGGVVSQASSMSRVIGEYDRGSKEVLIDGMMGSAATLVGYSNGVENVAIVPLGDIMIHEPSSTVRGRSKELREQAAMLETFTGIVAEIYGRRMKGGVEEAREAMARETFYDSKTAVEIGLADSVYEAEARGGRKRDRRRMSADEVFAVIAAEADSWNNEFGFMDPN